MAEQAAAVVDEARSLDRLVSGAFQLNASDIHLKSDATPLYRLGGHLRPVDFPRVDADYLYMLSARLSCRPIDEVRDAKQFEFFCNWKELGRLRGHYYRQRNSPALALRTIPNQIPSLSQLRLPAAIKQICELRRGLVLVTGATGMGKTTTIAAILNAIAESSCRHIVTVEDPIEFHIQDHLSSVAQREVGRDVDDYREGLRSALRQDPDVVMLGEIRDAETLDVALHASLTGHLVISAVHFTDATTTVEGIVGMLPSRNQDSLRHRLSQGLQAIVSQHLLPLRAAAGRVLAAEVMVSEPAVRACILDPSKTKGIRACLARNRQTNTLDQSLLQLLESKLISLESAQATAVSPGDLMREVNLRRLAT